jgi:predicted nucleotidyltransferase
MSEVKKFVEADLIAALKDISVKLRKKTRIYLIGGCAMTFIGAKAATKDIDVIVTSPKEAEDLIKAMNDAKFERVNKITSEYKVLDATIIMERPDKMRFDIFARKICGKLEIDKKMQSRATFYMSLGNLDVYLMSGEDIFLFKGMTERTADLDDMRILVERGIDWDVIKDACFLGH